MKKFFLSTMLLALPLLVSAYDCQVDGIYYNLIPNGNLAEVTFGDTKYSSSVTIPEKFTHEGVEYSVTSIGNYAFDFCSGLTSVTIPNSVTSIGEWVFAYCRGLTSVTIPNSVTSIGADAFYNCSSLTSVTIPNSVTSIGHEAFSGCSGLTYVHITDLAAWCKIAFSGYYSNPISNAHHLYLNGEEVKDLVIPNSVTSIGNSAFSSCRGLTSVTIPNSVTTIRDRAFEGCSGLTSVTIGNSVTRIGAWAFYGCSGLTSVTIPNSVTSIGEDAFSNCSGLTSVTIPNSVTSIGRYAFGGCSGLTSVTIPNSVTTIGIYTFYGCSGLTSVTIGSGVRYIDRLAFAECNNLEEVYCLAENVPSTSAEAFEKSYPEYTTLYVPAESLNAYKTTEPWSQFGFILPISGYDYKLTYMVDGGLFSSYTLKEGDAITPENAPTKEGYTFSGWSDLPETMPASDVTITGTFIPNKYKLTYFVDGVEYKSSEVEFGSTIAAEDNPTKEGYTFSGWSEIPETMPANDVTITGSFTINKYKLTYTLDGEEYKTAEVDYGTALTPEEAPVKEGYTFSGWSEIPETMPANDVTITGTFTVNKYKLTYMVDGEEYKASEVDYGTAITAEAVPTKEGYTFSGWSEIPSTMPAEDVTVTGSFTVNKYTITYMVDDAVLMTEEVAYGSTIAPPKSQKDGYDILWSFYPTTMPAYSITINGTYTTGINGLSMEEKDKQVFTPDGRRVETPKKGLNIIRMSDGTVKKVVVK